MLGSWRAESETVQADTDLTAMTGAKVPGQGAGAAQAGDEGGWPRHRHWGGPCRPGCRPAPAGKADLLTLQCSCLFVTASLVDDLL